MRYVRYSVAASLDGYIATPDGGFDWIVMDPDIDFAAMYDAVDALLMGRASYEVTLAMGGTGGPEKPTYVYSRTLEAGSRDGVTIVNDAIAHVRTLRDQDGKALWLWGGGALFRELANAGLVDQVEVAIIPVLLGAGLPLLATPGPRLDLTLRSHRLYATSGIMLLTYDVQTRHDPCSGPTESDLRAHRRLPTPVLHSVTGGSTQIGPAASRPEP